MTRLYLSVAFAVAAALSLGSRASAQIDFAPLAAGVQGCPELAADPGLGTLAAYLCQPVDRTSLDAPITRAPAAIRIRAGSFSILQRQTLLSLARGQIGESRFHSLLDLLVDSAVLSRPQEGLRRALLAEAAEALRAGDAAAAAAALAQANAILGGVGVTFDASIPELLAARIDRDRLADLRGGVFARLGGVDTVATYSPGVTHDLNGVANVAGAPNSLDAEGNPVATPDGALRSAYPFFAGPDGLANTFDDLPYVTNNPAAQAAGYSLAAPIAGTPEDRFDVTSAGRPVFTATAHIDVPNAANPSQLKEVEVYGIYNPYLITQFGCQGLGTFDTAAGTCSAAGSDITPAARESGCKKQAAAIATRAYGVGVNADGDCIELNSSSTGGSTQVQYEVLDLLSDSRLRPVMAGLEAVDLTDVVLAGLRFPARPVSPNGTTIFPPVTGAFRRNVDSETGALVRSSGGTCRIRESGGQAVGPNGVAGDSDDSFASDGECLLWGPPGATGAQALLSPASVAASHSANQTLFHQLCTARFDDDSADCPLDEIDDPSTAPLVYGSLGGLGQFGSMVLDGLQTVRTKATPLVPLSIVSPDILAYQFLAVNPSLMPTSLASQDVGLALERRQGSLLGCGSAFASPCGRFERDVWRNDAAISASLGGAPALFGLDLLNGNAGVLTQEFAAQKALHSGDLVGVSGASYSAGMNYSRQTGNIEVISVPGAGAAQIERGEYLQLTPADVLAMSDAQRAAYQHGDPGKVQADGWVEPMPWTTDPVALSTFGAVVFRADPTDPINGAGNVFNQAGGQTYGEYCGRWMNTAAQADVFTPFNRTCTALEIISANFERLLIATELVGQDRFFDPPESLAELSAMLDDDPSNDANGDPLSGPDGIFTRNQMVFSDSEVDFQVMELRNAGAASVVVAPADKQTAFDFLLSFNPNTSCPSSECLLQVSAVMTDPTDATSSLPLVLDLPIALTVDVVDEPSDPSEPPVPLFSTKVNLAALQATNLPALRRLMSGNTVEVAGEFLRLNSQQRNALFGPSSVSAAIPARDLNGDNVNDLDQDRDGVWDGMDDFTPGPVSDDAVACGSGIPGDSLLQEGIQYEPYRLDQAPGSSQFAAVFPNGLPPRSPTFCRSLNSLLGLIGTAPDGTRQFAWHGGIPTGASDADGDSVPDGLDSCPTVANPSQSDTDGDGVGDACDNCVTRANPRVGPDHLAQNPWATLTGGQRDDDGDGYGNRCDAKFPGTPGQHVGTPDLAQFLPSAGHARSADDCGRNGVTPCAIFDLDEEASMIGTPDRARFNELLIGKRPGPKCPTCPLTCESGPAGSCP